jgi:8-oxo-dGTP pyrophosphatase MutT (NUDIX family)
MSDLLHEERHKAIAIPVCISGGHPKFLTVRDRRFKDWIFVAGGCRKREVNNPLRCALRELEEETRGVISLKEGEYTTYTFRAYNRTDEELQDDQQRGIQVVSVYHVFILFVDMTQHERDTTIQRFNTEKAKMDAMKLRHLPIKRTYDENDMMLWSTLEEFSQRKQWDIIKYNVLNNPLFCRKLHESRSLFNIKRSYITNAAICGNGRIERPGCSDGKGGECSPGDCGSPHGDEGKGPCQVDEGATDEGGFSPVWRTGARRGGLRSAGKSVLGDV